MGNLAPVIAVTGLRREAVVLRGNGVEVIAGGGALERLAAELASRADGALGIVSFGMAGALDPALEPGDWVIADRLWGTVECECDARWVAALSGGLPGAWLGGAWCDGSMVAVPKGKGELFARTGAKIVDMESHIAAQAAIRAGLPFAIVRCVSDTARDPMPPAIAAAMGPGGMLALGSVLGSILTHPGQLPELARSVRRFSRAYVSLKQGARALGPRLAFDLR